MTPPPRDEGDPLLTVRAALIFLIAVLAGVAGGWLLHLQGQSLPAAVTGGAVAFAAAIPLSDSIIR